MKFFALALVVLLALFSCKTKTVDKVLPKDISLKPVRTPEQLKAIKDSIYRVETLKKLNSLDDSIKTLITSKGCDNPDDWRISPFGSKPCGGPASYIAYPKILESDILPKITDYNATSYQFNRRLNIVSDCSVVPAPMGILCVEGKAVPDTEGPPSQ